MIPSKMAHTFSKVRGSVDVTHVEGEVDPVRDLEIIHEELRLKDEQYIAKQMVCWLTTSPFNNSIAFATSMT